jgi:hypothetical protein
MALYTRATATKGDPARLEEGIAYFRDTVVPGAERAGGLVGAILHVDRETGRGSSATLWESVSAMNAAEQLANQFRQQGAVTTGLQVLDVDRFEIVVFDTPAEPRPSGYIRLVQMYAEPEKLGALTEFIKSEAHPSVKKFEGFRAFVFGVNRMTGRSFATIGFDSAEARAATEEAGARLRVKAAEIAGAPEPKVDPYETVFVKRVGAPQPA